MTKYVGRHRAGKHRRPSRKIPTKSVISTIAVAGLFAVPTHIPAEPTDNISPVMSQPSTTVEPPTPTTTTVITPPAEGDGLQKLEEWLADGAPGYIHNELDSKGVIAEKPDENVHIIQAVCTRAPAYTLGLSANAALVYDTVCALFPEVTAFGGLRPGDWGDHGSGNAIDAMIDSVNGDVLAQWLIDHASELPIKYIIWEQQIWQDFDGGRQWVMMEDRGSPTQNHYDHVHISVD